MATPKLSVAQKTFNKAYRHLLKQNAKSEIIMKNGARFCAYRGVEGRRCAAGPFIYNRDYDPSLEGCSAKQAEAADIIRKNGFDTYIAGQLQSIHDCYEPYQWKAQLELLAESQGLKIPAV